MLRWDADNSGGAGAAAVLHVRARRLLHDGHVGSHRSARDRARARVPPTGRRRGRPADRRSAERRTRLAAHRRIAARSRRARRRLLQLRVGGQLGGQHLARACAVPGISLGVRAVLDRTVARMGGDRSLRAVLPDGGKPDVGAAHPGLAGGPANSRASDKIAPDSVFVPGHSGDFLGRQPHSAAVPRLRDGSPSRVRRRAAASALFAVGLAAGRAPEPPRCVRSPGSRRSSVASATSRPRGRPTCFEQWDLRERQAKFICNSVRVYEHFGHPWRLPLFDHELMDFWARVPVRTAGGPQALFRVRARTAVAAGDRRQHRPQRGAETQWCAASRRPD